MLRVCDRVTVLRDGRTIARREARELSEVELIRLITGRADASDSAPRRPPVPGGRPVRLRVDTLRGAGFGPVSFSVHEGEVVGLCGLADAGQFAVGRALVGDVSASGGRLAVDGAGLPARRRTRRPQGGSRLHSGQPDRGRTRRVPHRRREHADESPGEMVAAVARQDRTTRRAAGCLQTFRVAPPAPDREVSTFSGGNQQKILLAKWLGFDRRLVDPERAVGRRRRRRQVRHPQADPRRTARTTARQRS